MTNRQYISALILRKKAYENKYTPSIYRALREQKKSVLLVAKRDGLQAALLQVNLITGEPIRKAIIKLYAEISPREAKWQYRLLNAIPIQQKAFGINFDFISDVADWLGRNILDKVVREITETARNRMYKAIVDGDRNGDSYDQILDRLSDVDLDKSRARLIARTESNRATNKGHDLAKDKYPFEVDKVWLAARDKRTRGAEGDDKADHFHMNEMIVAEDAPFIDPRSGAQLMFPGDSSLGAAAKDVCNCFLPDELTHVRFEDIKNVFRSFYNGKVITVETAKGSKFTCTPNHPILTTKGWVAAGMLTKESCLVDSYFIKDSSLVDFDVNDRPSTFEQIYNSFSKNRPCMRRIGAIMDFYGDGSTGDVDIVSAKSFLSNRAKLGKTIKNHVLKLANFTKTILFANSRQAKAFSSLFFRRVAHSIVGTGYQFKATSSIGLAHSQIHTGATAAGSDTPFAQSPANDLTGTVEFFGDFFNAETGVIEGYNFIDGIGCSKVQKIIHTEYYGHVYTFETVSGLYDIDSAVAKNCRCNLRFNPKRDAKGKLIMRMNRIVIPV